MDSLINLTTNILKTSGALFGYVFDFGDRESTNRRGRALYGTIRDDAVLRNHFRLAGYEADRAIREQKDGTARFSSTTVADIYEGYFVLVTDSVLKNVCATIAFHYYTEEDRSQMLDLVGALYRGNINIIDPLENPALHRIVNQLLPLLASQVAFACVIYELKQAQDTTIDVVAKYNLDSVFSRSAEIAFESHLPRCYAESFSAVNSVDLALFQSQAAKPIWQVILNSNAVRYMGCIVMASLPAVDENEASLKGNQIHSLFSQELRANSKRT